jgi:hypothetical protein
MRFILMTRATRHSEAGVRPSRESIDAMNAYHEELEKAGVLLAAERLYPSSSGLRMSFSRPGGQPSVTSGPLAEVNELVAGFTLIEVKSEEEAIEWALRVPDPHGYGEGVIELRQLFDRRTPAQDPRMRVLEDELHSQIDMLKKS